MIEEIDRFKRECTELGQNARTVSRALDALRGQGRLNQGVSLDNGGKLRIIFHDSKAGNGASVFGNNTVDSRIVALALAVQKAEPDIPTILVSKDINLRIKADILGLEAEDYESDRVLLTELYTGMFDMTIAAEKMARFRTEGELELETARRLFSQRILHAHRGNQPQAHRLGQGGRHRLQARFPSSIAAKASGASNRATANNISRSTPCWTTASSWSR